MFRRFLVIELLAAFQASKLVKYCSVYSYVDEEDSKSHHSNVLEEITRVTKDHKTKKCSEYTSSI